MIKRTIIQLRMLFALIWLAAAGYAALYETGVLDTGMLTESKRLYVLEVVAFFLTGGLIFLALKLFTFKMVRTHIASENGDGLRNYRRWSQIRLVMLAVPLFYDLTLYYDTLSMNGFYYALTVALASCFCWPSEQKMHHERCPEKEDNETETKEKASE